MIHMTALLLCLEGKITTVIVRKLFENHGVKKALLVSVADSFKHTETGKKNLENITDKYNCDLLFYKTNPQELASHMREDFVNALNPLRWLEEKIYTTPLDIARKYGIKLVFYGENPEFEYGASESLDVFHKATD